MEDNSFISGLSSIGEAIGESSYGRCITLWISRCEPSADAVHVRLGGPGCPWHVVQLPMRVPVTLHRAAGARVLRRATELAVATPSYAASAAADSDELHSSCDMAAMDVLTNMASAAAGSTLLFVPNLSGGAGDAPDAELIAADVAGEDGAALHVHFRWAIGEVLPGAPLSREAQGDEDEPEAESADLSPASAAAAEVLLGDEDSTPNSSASLTPFKASAAPVPEAAVTPPIFGDRNDGNGADSARSDGEEEDEEDENERGAEKNDTEANSESDPREGNQHPQHPLVPSPPPVAGDGSMRAQSPTSSLPAPLPLPPYTHSNGTPDPIAVSFNENDFGLPHRETSATPSGGGGGGGGGGSSSSRSHTPRRQRPRSARRSTVQMDLAPVMEEKVEQKAEEAAEEATAATSTDASVHISDDDEDDMPPHAMHRPPPPAPPQQSSASPFIDSTSDDQQEAPKPSSAAPRSAETVTNTPSPTPPRPAARSAPAASAENLFEGVAASAMLVAVAVVGVVNTKGTADPHRVVSVAIEGGADPSLPSSTAAAATVSFRTAPTLRSLAAVVPQLSPPALLESDGARGRVTLHTTCTVTESVASTTSAATPAASTVLWSSRADVRQSGSAAQHEPQQQQQHSFASSSSALSAAALAATEVRFKGANGDLVITRWTFLTVGAYREAALNLRCRADEPGEPTLQLLLVADDAAGKNPAFTTKKSAHMQQQMTTSAHIWMSAPALSGQAAQHRFATAAPPHALLQQPVHMALRDPLGCISVHIPAQRSRRAQQQQQQQPGRSRKPATHIEPILFCAFSETWTRAATIPHTPVTLYYRIVAPAASLRLSTLTPQLPDAVLNAMTETAASQQREAEAATLREVVVTVQPPKAIVSSVFDSAATSSIGDSSSWSLVLRHADTHAVLAEAPATATAAALTYRTFLPLTPDAETASCCRPWEVLLIPAASASITASAAAANFVPTPPANRPARRNSRSALHDAQQHHHSNGVADRRKDVRSAEVWKGELFVSSAQLYTAASAEAAGAAGVSATLCVSAPAASKHSGTATSLPSSAAPLGALVEVSCEVRHHRLDAQSAVFCLRSLRLVSSPITSGSNGRSATEGASAPTTPGHVLLWFSASGSSAADLQAAFAPATPTVKDVQRAWAPHPASPQASSRSPPLRTDASGQLVPTGAPVLLSTDNTRARLCVAYLPRTATAATASVEEEEKALRRCVAAVRKRAIHRYRKARAAATAGEDAEQEEETLSPEAVAEMHACCLDAVAMRVDNYAEVDLQASLVASSEHPGKSRHRLLLSSVCGTVRLSRGLVVEVRGQWVKVPRKVTHIAESYTPSPRLWAIRCSCVVRRTGADGNDDDERDAVPSAAAVDGPVPLAQEVLEAERGYEVTARSIPLDYSDPSEETVQKALPGLSFDSLVVQTKRADRGLQAFCETVPSVPATDAPQEESAMLSEETGELLDYLFGPTGVAHNAYISDASHKVAVVKFVFGDAYTTRTVLNVSCAPVGASAPTQSGIRGGSAAGDDTSPTVQIVCDSLTRSSVLYSFLPEAAVTRLFPGVSHRRYPPELAWYHGSLAIPESAEQQRRQEAQAAWLRGLTEASLGVQQKPGPFVVSAVTHHPYESLPLLVETSLTRCLNGHALFAFGGVSTTTGAATSHAFVLDVPHQRWLPLKVHRDGGSGATPPPRCGHSAVFRTSDGAVYLFGGRGQQQQQQRGDGASGAAVFADVWKLEWSMRTATLTCVELPCTIAEATSFATSSSMVTMDNDASQLARWRHAAVLHDDYLIVLGGLSSTGTCCSCRDVLYLDIKTCEWCVRRSFGSEAPSPRYGHAAAVSNNTFLYVFGGTVLTDGATPTTTKRAADSISSDESDGDDKKRSGDDGDGDDGGALSLSDFYKMDLITRMWSRVEPNGTLRPPALELADMSTCTLSSCPVLILVGGRTAAASTDAVGDDGDDASAYLSIFLFSTATSFWRRVRMDCTPVPNRFGLRAVASAAAAPAAHTKSTPTKGAAGEDAAGGHDASRLRRLLPTRGQRIGDVVVVGGLPLEEAAVVETSPAITLLLSAGNGGAAASRAPSVTAAPQTPRLPSMPRNAPRPVPRRPATGPPRTAPRRPAPWTQQQQQRGEGDEAMYENPPMTTPVRSPSVIRKMVHRLHSRGSPSPSKRGGGAPSSCLTVRTAGNTALRFNPERPSCYSTLTRRQQRQLVRRLYTNDLETRAAHRELLEEQVHLERTTPAFPSTRSRSRSCSPGRQTGAPTRPARVTSAPFQRPACATTPNASPIPATSTERKRGRKAPSPALSPAATTSPVPASHRDLWSAFLSRSSSGSSHSSLTASSSPSLSSSRSASAATSSASSFASAAASDSEAQKENSSYQPSEHSADEASAPSTPRHAAAEPSNHSEQDHETSHRSSEVSKSESGKAAEREDSEEKEGEALAADSAYADSFAASSSSSLRDSPAHEEQLPVHDADVVPPPASTTGHHREDDSHLENSFSAATSGHDALATTQTGNDASSPSHTAADASAASSASSAAVAYVQRTGVEEISADEEDAKDTDASAPASPRSSAAGDAANSEEAAAEEDEEDKEEKQQQQEDFTSVAAPVLPIALESDHFPQASEGGASEAFSDSSHPVAAAEEEEEDEAAAASAAERESAVSPPGEPAGEASRDDDGKSDHQPKEDAGDDADDDWESLSESAAMEETAHDDAPPPPPRTPSPTASESHHDEEDGAADSPPAATAEEEEAEDGEAAPEADDAAADASVENTRAVSPPPGEPADDDAHHSSEPDPDENADDEEEWESLSESAAGEEAPVEQNDAAPPAQTPTPLASVKSTDEKREKWDDDDDDGALVPPPAPREHATPPTSSAASSVIPASPAEPSSASERSTPDNDHEEDNKGHSSVASEGRPDAEEGENEPALKATSVSTASSAPLSPASAPAAAPAADVATASEDDDESEKASQEGDVSPPPAAAALSSAASVEDGYDDDFSEAAASAEVAAEVPPMPLAESDDDSAGAAADAVEEAQLDAPEPHGEEGREVMEEEEPQRETSLPSSAFSAQQASHSAGAASPDAYEDDLGESAEEAEDVGDDEGDGGAAEAEDAAKATPHAASLYSAPEDEGMVEEPETNLAAADEPSPSASEAGEADEGERSAPVTPTPRSVLFDDDAVEDSAVAAPQQPSEEEAEKEEEEESEDEMPPPPMQEDAAPSEEEGEQTASSEHGSEEPREVEKELSSHGTPTPVSEAAPSHEDVATEEEEAADAPAVPAESEGDDAEREAPEEVSLPPPPSPPAMDAAAAADGEEASQHSSVTSPSQPDAAAPAPDVGEVASSSEEKNDAEAAAPAGLVDSAAASSSSRASSSPPSSPPRSDAPQDEEVDEKDSSARASEDAPSVSHEASELAGSAGAAEAPEVKDEASVQEDNTAPSEHESARAASMDVSGAEAPHDALDASDTHGDVADGAASELSSADALQPDVTPPVIERSDAGERDGEEEAGGVTAAAVADPEASEAPSSPATPSQRESEELPAPPTPQPPSTESDADEAAEEPQDAVPQPVIASSVDEEQEEGDATPSEKSSAASEGGIAEPSPPLAPAAGQPGETNEEAGPEVSDAAEGSVESAQELDADAAESAHDGDATPPPAADASHEHADDADHVAADEVAASMGTSAAEMPSTSQHSDSDHGDAVEAEAEDAENTEPQDVESPRAESEAGDEEHDEVSTPAAASLHDTPAADAVAPATPPSLEMSDGEGDAAPTDEEQSEAAAAPPTPPAQEIEDDDDESSRSAAGEAPAAAAVEAEAASSLHSSERPSPADSVHDEDEVDDERGAGNPFESPAAAAEGILHEAAASDTENVVSHDDAGQLSEANEAASLPADGDDADPAELSAHTDEARVAAAAEEEEGEEVTPAAALSPPATDADEEEGEERLSEAPSRASSQQADDHEDAPTSPVGSEPAMNPFAAHDAAAATPPASDDGAEESVDSPPAPAVAASAADEEEEDAHDDGQAAAAPAAMASDWGDELSSPPESHPTVSNAPAAATTHDASDDEARESASAAELEDGRDLLDRRRGVEEAVQDDDFDF